MKRSPKVGDAADLTFVVTEQHVIDFAEDVMPVVLCTPWLIWFLEHAAREAMLPLLDSDESTVGVRIDVEHLAPTPVGETVTCTARVIHVDGTLVSLSLKARDEHEEIASGTHKLRIIRKDRFARRVLAKAADKPQDQQPVEKGV
jgi:predicted thioesterase